MDCLGDLQLGFDVAVADADRLQAEPVQERGAELDLDQLLEQIANEAAWVLGALALTGFVIQPAQATLKLVPQAVQLDVDATTVLDLAITQVGYDTPGDDALEEFIDLYNPGADAVG